MQQTIRKHLIGLVFDSFCFFYGIYSFFLGDFEGEVKLNFLLLKFVFVCCCCSNLALVRWSFINLLGSDTIIGA